MTLRSDANGTLGTACGGKQRLRRAGPRLVDTLATGGPPLSAVRPKPTELEGKKKDLARRLDEVQPGIIELHPKAIEIYLASIDRLAAMLAPRADKEMLATVRDLVKQIAVCPRENSAPVVIDIAGRMAALLKPSVRSLVPRAD